MTLISSNSCASDTITKNIVTNPILSIVDSLQIELDNLNIEAINSLSSLQQALDTWNTSIDLSSGWNMLGGGSRRGSYSKESFRLPETASGGHFEWRVFSAPLGSYSKDSLKLPVRGSL